MYCPFCQEEETKVIDSRLNDEGSQVRRRRECLRCKERFTTYEIAELTLPRIVKRDGTRCSFELDKLRKGMLKALEKRPVPMEKIELGVQNILHKVRASGEREIQSHWLGELVMEELRQLDQIAYVRFASVYRSFKDIHEFAQEIQRLKQDENAVEEK
jgi:transcriptional repressor NrdR